MRPRSLPAPRRLAHVALYVSDIERSRHFYSEVLGLLFSEEHVLWRELPLARVVSAVLARVPNFAHGQIERAVPFHYRGAHATLCFLSCGERHHDLVLTEMHDPVRGTTRPVSGNALRGLSFMLAVSPECYAERLRARGLEPRWVKDAVFGERLEVEDPDGRTVGFLAPEALVSPAPPAPLAYLRSAEIRTTHLAQSLPRWRALGFQPGEPVSEELAPGHTRLSCALGTGEVPAPGVVLVEERTPQGVVPMGGHSLDHLAFEMNPPTPVEGDPAVVRQMASRLRRAGLRILAGPLLHDPVEGDGTWGRNHSVYALDEDGHVLELYSGMEPYTGARTPHEGLLYAPSSSGMKPS